MSISISVPVEVEKFGFVARACEKDDYRPTFKGCVYRDGLFLATDGKRLHLLEIKDDPRFKEGFTYTPIVNTKKSVVFEESEGDELPNIKHFLEEKKRLRSCTVAFKSKHHPLTSSAICKVIKLLPEGKGINFNFLWDLPQGVELFCQVFEDVAFLTIENNNLGISSIIMPTELRD